MRFSLLLAFVLLAGSLHARAAETAQPPEIENEQILGINKEPWHATLMPYGSLGEALAARRAKSSFARSLNGTWKFHWVPRPEQRPVEFYKPEFDTAKWDNIAVPSNWQVLGYGTPYYRNAGYTFQRDWPRVLSEPPRNWTAYSERNPVGSYRRTFAIPGQWSGRRIFLTFDGVDSAFFLWINGRKVGYSTNSRNAAEFDITPYVRRDRQNTVAVEVYRYCAGSYLEDQDMWRLSGIFRNVTLWSAPPLHVRDFSIHTNLDNQYRNALLYVTATVRNYGSTPTAGRVVEVALYDRLGHPVTGIRGQAVLRELPAGEEATVRLRLPVANPAKWTAETPNLYTTVISLQDGARTEEILSARTGFRQVEIKGRLFTVNGVPVKLKGANRHEHWPDTGHYVSEARMIRDIEVLKQANCNHVRTCHYSDDPRWYELCDEYGLYVVAEANVECHGYYGVLDREPRYRKDIVDRNVANVENFKNSPSVVIWSLGNECGGGPNFRAALEAIKLIDRSRPTHYEPFGIGSDNPADIDSRMYTGVDGVARIAESDTFTKPFYLCEYAHAMFNSMGSIGEYNDVFDAYPSVMGGAIWEWEDQGLWNRRDPKRQYLAYGGGFGEIPNDGFFIHKGVVFSDRSPKPHFPEAKRAYQWVGFAAEDLAAGKIKIRNKFAFTDLGKYRGRWTITEDGTPVADGALPRLDLAPGAEKILSLALPRRAPRPGAAYLLNVAVELAKDEPWAKAGYDIANAQFPLPGAPASAAAAGAMKPLALARSGDRITVRGESFAVRFDGSTGFLTGLDRGGVNLLLPGGGPRLHLWRARHRNDDDYAWRDWNAAGLTDLQTRVLQTDAQQIAPGAVRIIASVDYAGKADFGIVHTAVYTIYGDGTIAVDNALSPRGPRIRLARIGVRLLLDKRLGALDYFARGPMENYADRKRGSDIGRYHSSVRDQLTPYSKPMECGNHEDMRWLALLGRNLPPLLAQAEDGALQFSALPYTDEELDRAAYAVDLPASRATVLCIGAKTLGVGSNSCGPAPLPQYMVTSSPATFRYVLRLPPAGADLAAVARVLPPQGRGRPALAERDAAGLVTLTPGDTADALEYSLDGMLWSRYAAPFPLTRAATLHVRSAVPGGPPVTGVFVFDPFVDRSKWKVEASSFQRGEGEAEHLIDGNPATFWHSRYSPALSAAPHFVVVDLGEAQNLAGIALLPRQDMPNGRVKNYEVYLSADATTWGEPILRGRLADTTTRQKLMFPSPQKARYLKLVVLSDHSGENFGAIAEIETIPER